MKKGELDTKLNRYKVHLGDVVSLIGETHRNINKNVEVAQIKSGNLTKTCKIERLAILVVFVNNCRVSLCFFSFQQFHCGNNRWSWKCLC